MSAESVVHLVADDEPLDVAVAPPTRARLDELMNQYPPSGAVDAPAARWGEGFEVSLLVESVRPGLSARDAEKLWEETGSAADEVVAAALGNAPEDDDLVVALARYRADARYALEVGYCSAHGIPRSTFLGWAHADQAAALAGVLGERDRCPGCGAAGPLMDRPDLGRIEARRCVHCEILEQARDAVPRAERASIHMSVIPTRADDEGG